MALPTTLVDLERLLKRVQALLERHRPGQETRLLLVPRHSRFPGEAATLASAFPAAAGILPMFSPPVIHCTSAGWE